MKALAKNVAALLLIVIGAGVIGALDRPTPSLEYKLFNYVESGLPSFDPVTLIDYISEYECTGRQSPMKFPVSYTAPGNTVMVRRSYANTTGLLVNVRSTYDPSRLVLVGQELQPLGYPFKMTGDYFPYLLYLNRDALEINIKGDLFNYTGWDGETYHVLRVTYVNPFSVKSDPKPLSEAQVELYTDQVYYHVDDTAKVTIRNLSDDWLLTDRSLTLYRDVNGS